MSGHPAHHHQETGGLPLEILLPAVFLVLLAGGYVLLADRARRRNAQAGWSRWRTGWFLAGCALLAAGLLPPIAPWAHGGFQGHMLQHLLIGMYAPLGLVLGAPVTLLLRNLPADQGRRLSGLVQSGPLHALANPVTALLLSVGTLGLLYFTPLYNTVAANTGLHWLLHAHFLLAGCLFAYVIAGPDPAPARPSVPVRLVVLGMAIAAHAVISQLMYGGFGINIHAPVDQVQGGAQIMYYGGDIAELLLAVALVATWRPQPGSRRASRPTALREARPAVP
ncbi:cytochrome c oxidase assembly protein [Streptomyces sp. NBC_01696]|uniref:cytochrome c oxidase assembly protein n=1 Tax=unclassified Streptomyces TaxID=2593676 RepID=UPI0029ADA6A4|nr:MULTISPECIES: cytochrome c oxidase assembly protein [unclassified Streptomyces]MDX3686193.1 cytochrome c oxidase assembly protein [Streptomyces sp. AK04-4c]